MEIKIIFLELLNFITGVSYLLLFKSIIDNINYKKRSIKVDYVFIILCSIFIFMFKFESSIIFILICFSFYIINYEQNILKCIFISVLYWLLVYISIEYISIDLVFNINYNELIYDLNRNFIVVNIESMIIQDMFILIIFQICIQINKFKSFINIYIS